MNHSFYFLSLSVMACSNSSDPDLETLEHDGLTRTYSAHIPASYDANTAVPMVFNFHGGCMDAGSQRDEMDMRNLADTENFILVYPEGTSESGDGSCLIWNSGPYVDQGDTKATADDLGFVRSLVEELSSQYSVDNNRVYATGFSNGGFMTYAVGCYLSDLFAAIAPIAAMMNDEALNQDSANPCQPSHPMPVVHLHGTDDRDVRVDAGEQAIEFWVGFNGTTNVTSETAENGNQGTIEHFTYSGDGKTNVSVEYYKIEGGSHATFDDIDFNGSDSRELIWDYVSRYQLNDTSDSPEDGD